MPHSRLVLAHWPCPATKLNSNYHVNACHNLVSWNDSYLFHVSGSFFFAPGKPCTCPCCFAPDGFWGCRKSVSAAAHGIDQQMAASSILAETRARGGLVLLFCSKTANLWQEHVDILWDAEPAGCVGQIRPGHVSGNRLKVSTLLK